MAKLTPPQRRILDNLHRGKPAEHGLSGSSPHGGIAWAVKALQQKGLLDEGRALTQAGMMAIGEMK